MPHCWKSHVNAQLCLNPRFTFSSGINSPLPCSPTFCQWQAKNVPEILIYHIPVVRDAEIPCPTWSHFIQDKLKISIYLSLDKCKICIKLIKILYFIFLLIIMSSHVALKTVWILSSWLLKKPADLELHCLQESWYLHGFILFSKV